MIALAWTAGAVAVVNTVLLVIVLVANDEIRAENTRLRTKVHPSGRAVVTVDPDDPWATPKVTGPDPWADLVPETDGAS